MQKIVILSLRGTKEEHQLLKKAAELTKADSLNAFAMSILIEHSEAIVETAEMEEKEQV